MSVVALLQDPVQGGAQTVVGWYRRWMRRRDLAHTEYFLDETDRGGLRPLARWNGDTPNIPRVLPKLHVPPFWFAARRFRRLSSVDALDTHVVGASILHGSLTDDRIALVWFGTLIADERRTVPPLHRGLRRALHSVTLPALSSLERDVLERSDRILAQSHHTAELVRAGVAIKADQVEVVPVPVDTDVYRPNADQVRHGILFVGRAHDPRKGFSRLVSLVEDSRAVRSRGVTAVSPPPGLGFIDGIRSIGPVDDLAAVYRAHELFVLPSLQEGLGIVAFEAMACGTPVVAWRCGGPDRFIEESGAGVLVGSRAELRSAVEELLADHGTRVAMGEAGRRYVEKTFSASRFLGDDALFGVSS